MSSRKHLTLKTKLAAALRELFQIPYDHAKIMTEDQVLSLATYDHGILHGVKVVDDHWNITPRMIVPHREKSRTDAGVVAKVKRVELKYATHRGRIEAKGNPTAFVYNNAALAAVVHPWPSRPIPSRPFQKRKPAS